MKRLCRTIIVVLLLSLVSSFISFDALAINVSAKAYCLINADTGEILSASNPYLRLPMASTTKLMTSLILAESKNLDTEITVTEEMVTVEGSSMGLLPGDSVSYYELLVGMLLPSGNDAANTAAISVAGSLSEFSMLMNEKAKHLGMNNTNFVTPSGLDDKEHYSCAYDMSLLASAVLKNSVLKDIVCKERITVSYGNPPYQRTLYNHNKLLGEYEMCIGLKTGYTKKSGRCLVSAARKNNCTVICVTLNDPDDWNDHKRLFDFGFEQLKSKSFVPNMPINNIPVINGDSPTLYIAAPKTDIGISAASNSNIDEKYIIPRFVYAPIKHGQAIGYVEYYYNDKLVTSTEIIALNNVDFKTKKPSFAFKFVFIFKKILRVLI